MWLPHIFPCCEQFSNREHNLNVVFNFSAKNDSNVIRGMMINLWNQVVLAYQSDRFLFGLFVASQCQIQSFSLRLPIMLSHSSGVERICIPHRYLPSRWYFSDKSTALHILVSVTFNDKQYRCVLSVALPISCLVCRYLCVCVCVDRRLANFWNMVDRHSRAKS